MRKVARLRAGRSYYSWELVCALADPTTPRGSSTRQRNRVLLEGMG